MKKMFASISAIHVHIVELSKHFSLNKMLFTVVFQRKIKRDQCQTLRQSSFLEGGTRERYWKESRRTS